MKTKEEIIKISIVSGFSSFFSGLGVVLFPDIKLFSGVVGTLAGGIIGFLLYAFYRKRASLFANLKNKVKDYGGRYYEEDNVEADDSGIIPKMGGTSIIPSGLVFGFILWMIAIPNLAERVEIFKNGIISFVSLLLIMFSTVFCFWLWFEAPKNRKK